MVRFFIFLVFTLSLLGCKAESDYERALNESTDNDSNFTELELTTANEDDYFVVETEIDSREFFYTNSKGFYFDKEGYLVTNSGLPLMILPVYSDGESLSNSISVSKPLKVDYSSGSPIATDKVTLSANFQQDSNERSNQAFDRKNALSYNYSTSLSIFDSLGEEHNLTLYFINIDSESNTWSFRLGLDDEDVTVNNEKIIDFNSNGELDINDSDSDGYLTVGNGTVDSLYIPLNNGAEHLNMQLDFTSLMTSFNSQFEVYSIEATGFYTGNIESIKFESDGLIKLTNTNGEQQLLGRVALARFSNSEGLNLVADSLWQETDDSGMPVYGEPRLNGFGEMVPIEFGL